jgi:hypothetical protein
MDKNQIKLLIETQREQMQNDLLCILDGIDDQNILDNACQVIVDRCNILITELVA